MPDLSIHDFTCDVVFGRKFTSVDRNLDWFVRCMGRSHRRGFHDLLTAPIVGILAPGSLLGAAAAVLHILVDDTRSKNKDFEQLLKILAKSASQENH